MENKMHDLKDMITQLEKLISPNFCEEIAEQTGFIERSSSQIKGFDFLQAIVIPNGFVESETLNSLATRMHTINPECNLSASALAQRMYTAGAERFMQSCFSKAFQEMMKKDAVKLGDLAKFEQFGRILIEDSTMIELHKNLKEVYKGRGGAASEAALKVNLIFDFKLCQIIEMTTFSANIPDQSLADRIVPLLKKNDLVIRDLGYYALDKIKQIAEKAYFISRFKSNVTVYETENSTEPLDLAKFIERNMVQGITDVIVFIGKERYPVRLVACRMSQEAINKRRRDANRTAQRCGRKTSEKKSKLLDYGIFITNVSNTTLSSVDVMAIYRVRWKAELIFKEWKSCLKIHVFKGYKERRINCLIYGRLIMVFIAGSISSLLMQYAFSIGKELSSYKLINYLIGDHVFPTAIRLGTTNQFIERLMNDLPRRLCMDKRTRFSLRQNARHGISYYDELLNQDLKTGTD